MKNPKKDVLVVGFAMFAIFFGSGNLIFPPQIGLLSGEELFPAIIGLALSGILFPMLAVAADYPWPMEVFMDGAAYARADYVAHPTAFGASSDTYVRTTRKPVADIEDFVRRNISHIEGLNLIVADMEEKRVIRSRLEQIKDIYVTSSVPRYLEVSRGGVCKGTALQYLAKRLGISREEILAFGDGEIDFEMLQYAGIGVAMENGEKKLQAAADRIAPDCDADGMAKTIQELIFDGENEL